MLPDPGPIVPLQPHTAPGLHEVDSQLRDLVIGGLAYVGRRFQADAQGRICVIAGQLRQKWLEGQARCLTPVTRFRLDRLGLRLPEQDLFDDGLGMSGREKLDDPLGW